MVATHTIRPATQLSDASKESVVGSGNYLADRRHADPEETKLKYLISNEIAVLIENRGLSQTRAAELTALAQPDISRIVNGNVKDYSVWRLMRALAALGKDITLTFSDAREAGAIYTEFRESAPQNVAP